MSSLLRFTALVVVPSAKIGPSKKDLLEISLDETLSANLFSKKKSDKKTKGGR